MRQHITYNLIILVLIFGQISCSSDKSSTTNPSSSSTSFDFNLRVYDHTIDQQQLSSFGNSNLKLNDYIITYQGKDLFPNWDKDTLKSYNMNGLKKVDVHVICYDNKKQKIQKTTSFSRAQFRVFETIPEEILLEDTDQINCEYIVTGWSNEGSDISIVKMVSVLMDSTTDFRVFPELVSSRIYISPTDFSAHLKTRNLLKVDTMDLVCRNQTGEVMHTSLLSKDSMDSITISGADLSMAKSCRLLSTYKEDLNISEIIIFKVDDINVTNTYFAPFYPSENGTTGNNHFYTFTVTNTSDKTYELAVDTNKIQTQIEDYGAGGKTKEIFLVNEQIRFSKVTIGNNKLHLLPKESVEIYIDVQKVLWMDVLGLVSLNHGPVNASMYRGHRFTDVTVQLDSGSFSIKENSDSPYFLPLPVQASSKLREAIEARKNSHPYNSFGVSIEDLRKFP